MWEGHRGVLASGGISHVSVYLTTHCGLEEGLAKAGSPIPAHCQFGAKVRGQNQPTGWTHGGLEGR